MCLSLGKQRHTLCLLITLEARGETLSKTFSYPHIGLQALDASVNTSGPAWVSESYIYTTCFLCNQEDNDIMPENGLSNSFPQLSA